MMKYTTLAVSAIAACILASTAAIAASPAMGEAPYFGPGPSFVPAKPYYADETHTQSDYSYWQEKRNREIAERTKHEQDMAAARAQADRLIAQEQLEQQRMAQQQQMMQLQPAR